MKALRVARKSLIEMLREPQLLLLELLLPLVFVGIAAATYSAPLLVTHPVILSGAEPDAPLVAELEAQRYADGRPVFDLTLSDDRAAAEAALQERDATVLAVLAPGGVTLHGDPLNPRFLRASTLLNEALNRHADRVAGRPSPVAVVERPLAAAGPQTEFDLYAPGMMMFALLLLIPQTAMLVAREIRWGTLRRLRLTRLRAWELLGGISLAQMAVAVVQTVVVLAGALALGFHNQGPLWLAVTVGLAVSLGAVGQGLVVACFSANDSEAANIGGTVTMLQVFLSGSFYQLPPLTLFTLLGHPIDLFDVFPATHGFLALQQVLVYGATLDKVAFRLMMTLLLSLLYLVVGVLVFHRRQMRRGR